jgi:adenylate cyclase
VRVRKSIALGFFVAAIGILLRPTSLGLRLEEEVGLRWLFAIRGPIAPPPDVVIVSIDKGSAQQLGMDPEEWPPPRHVHARVIRSLHRHGVSAIVMDIWFDRHRSPADDDDLARAMAESGNVVLVQRVDRPRVPGAGLSTELLRSPISQFQQSAVSLAPFPLSRTSSVPVFWPFFETSAGVVPTLPAAALQIHALPVLDRLRSSLDHAGVRSLHTLPRRVTSAAESRQLMQLLRRELEHNPLAAKRALAGLDAAAPGDLSATERRALSALVRLYSGRDTYYLNFYGPAGSITTIPFHELLQDEQEERRDLRGKVVFVGESASVLTTSAAQADSHLTVFSTGEGVDLSGTEIGATAFANLLTNQMLTPIDAVTSFVVLLAFGGLVGFLFRLLPGTHATATAISLGIVFAVVAQFLFTADSLLLPLAVPLLVQLPVALFVGLFSRYRDIRKQMPIEVDPYARQQLFNGVCLTTDVKGYTALAEHLSRDELHDLLSEYHKMLRKLVAARRGLVWGRGGDSALCVWKISRGLPWLTRVPARWLGHQRYREKEGRLNACLAAIEIRDAIDRFNAAHPTRKQMPTRIGLDAGEVGLGPVAGELQAVGDPANAASRIEEVNKLFATKLLASAAVVHGLEMLLVRRLGFFVLPGKSDAVEIFEILGRREAVGDADRRLCERFAAGLELFESGNWSGAAESFQQVAQDYPQDGPAGYYRDLSARHATAALPPIGHSVIRIDAH